MGARRRQRVRRSRGQLGVGRRPACPFAPPGPVDAENGRISGQARWTGEEEKQLAVAGEQFFHGYIRPIYKKNFLQVHTHDYDASVGERPMKKLNWLVLYRFLFPFFLSFVLFLLFIFCFIIIVNSPILHHYSFFKAITANDALALLNTSIWLSHEIF